MAKPTLLLDAQLKALRLPTFLREYDKVVSSHWRFHAVPHSHGRPPVGAFRDAIHEVVGPGSVVADIGTGSGILGMYACEARALRVYSIEEGPMIAVARAVSRANGFEGRQIFVYGSSTAIGLPENVDVIMADQIGHFGCEAGMFEFFADARARFMKPDGVAMPSHLGLYLAAIEDAEVFGWVQFWRQHPGGFDFEPARAWSAHTGYPKKLNADQLLGDPVRAFAIPMADVSTGMYASDVTITVQRAGTLHGLGGWFEAQLSPSVTLTNSPVATTRMQRRNAVFPIQEPVDVRPGDEVAVSMQFRGPETLINWKVEVWARSATGERRRTAASSHSTFKGLLFPHEDLVRLRPDSRPVLDERGRARMTVLELCDGSRPLMEIEQEVYHRHRTLFGTDRNAAGFVAEVITRYTHPRAGS